MNFIDEVVEDVKKSVNRLKASNDEHVEPLIEMIEELARIKALRVLDIWLDILGEELENEAVSKLYKRIKELRFVEMEDKEILEIKNVLTKDNELLYSGFDDLEAWDVFRKNKEVHPDIRMEYWQKGILKNIRFS